MKPRDITAKAAELDRHLTLFARRTMHREKAACRDHAPLTRQEFRVVHELGERQDWTMTELAGSLVCGMSSLTALIDRLEAKRLVGRRRSDQDRRTVHVRLTAAGRRHFTRMRRMHQRFCRGMLGALSTHEQDVFLALMRKIAGPPPETPARRAEAGSAL